MIFSFCPQGATVHQVIWEYKKQNPETAALLRGAYFR